MDNPAEKVDECPLNRGRKVLFAYSWDRESCPLYGVAGCPLLRGCLLKLTGGQWGLSELSVISQMAIVDRG